MIKTARLGEKLRAARIAADLSAAQVARRMDPPVSPQRIRNIELGLSEPSLEMVLRICAALGCDPHSIDSRLASTKPKRTPA